MSDPDRTTFSLTIFQRTLILCLAVALVSALGYGFLMSRISDMVEVIRSQSAQVQAQQAAVEGQTRLSRSQKALIDLQSATQRAYALYSQYVYWRLNAAATGDEQSTRNGDEAEAQLRSQLATIAGMDEGLAEAIDVVNVYLDDFNSAIGQAIERLIRDEPRKRVASKIAQAQSASMAMNATFESILEETGQRVSQASTGVLQAADKVAVAAQHVQAGTGAVLEQGETLAAVVPGIMGGTLVLALLVGLAVSQSITRPIQRLHRVIESIGRDHDLTRRVHYTRNNEIGAIGQAVNTMLDTFASIMEDMRALSLQLTETARQARDNAQATRQNAEQLQQETDLVATASNEMTVTVKGINDHTRNTTEVAIRAQQACLHSHETVTTAKGIMAHLANSIRDAAEAVDDVSHRAESISSVLDVIRGISEQTNLLALNAAIEAARAGDQGRGFAVVADEVRTLAQKTGNSTDEIQSVIENLQSVARQSVERMQRNVERARTTQNHSDKTAEAIQDALSAVEEISEAMQHISTATTEQTQAAENIDRSIMNISQLASEVNETANVNSQASVQLSTMAERLNTAISRFRLNA
ncbi:methyl-accepting chemotaxis protein [Hahella sp. SMD15-11]|uniref:Methyl-accepting chemotaxis protein n=1 Tax=Thermohahella caldifontis TaxID=3142973 RepID=A0AB39UZC6_9GAMM